MAVFHCLYQNWRLSHPPSRRWGNSLGQCFVLFSCYQALQMYHWIPKYITIFWPGYTVYILELLRLYLMSLRREVVVCESSCFNKSATLKDTKWLLSCCNRWKCLHLWKLLTQVIDRTIDHSTNILSVVKKGLDCVRYFWLYIKFVLLDILCSKKRKYIFIFTCSQIHSKNQANCAVYHPTALKAPSGRFTI